MKDKEKRFPANVDLSTATFLNDKHINGELYALLQGKSKYTLMEDGKYETYVLKKDMPTQAKMCEILDIKSPKTLKSHLNYLLEQGYVEEKENRYVLPEMENIYFLVPLATVKYLNDNCKDHVVKTYIYLGQRYKWSLERGIPYTFTLEEIGNHLGLKIKNSSRGYEIINNALDLLCNSGLIDYITYFDGQMSKKKLINFSFEHKVNKK